MANQITIKTNAEKHLEIKNAAKSQEMSLQTYLIELHNQYIHGKQMVDRDQLLRNIKNETKLSKLLHITSIILLTGVFILQLLHTFS